MAALRLAIIGYGAAGRGIHARLAREAGFSVPVVVVRNPNRRQLAASDWPGARFVNSVSELVALKNLFDVAVIASPTSNHAENAATLARAGIPFVIDKPMGIDAFEARAVISEADATGTPFTVFHNRRWDSEQQGLIKVLREKQLGDIHTFERRWERYSATQKHQWREDDVIGGGVLLDLQVHLVDAAVQLFGPVESVYATIRSISSKADDDTLLVLEHAPGGGVAKSKLPVISRLTASTVVGAPGPRSRVLGTKGAYVTTSVPNDPSAFAVNSGKAHAEKDLGWIIRGPEKTEIKLPVNREVDFYHALPGWLSGEGEAPVNPADALQTQIVLDAARVSARENRVVNLKEFTKPTPKLKALK